MLEYRTGEIRLQDAPESPVIHVAFHTLPVQHDRDEFLNALCGRYYLGTRMYELRMPRDTLVTCLFCVVKGLEG